MLLFISTNQIKLHSLKYASAGMLLFISTNQINCIFKKYSLTWTYITASFGANDLRPRDIIVSGVALVYTMYTPFFIYRMSLLQTK